MDDGYTLAVNPLYQGGSWNHDSDLQTPPVPAVFKWMAGNTSWSRWQLDVDRGSVRSLAIHPVDDSILYAGGLTEAGGVMKAVLWYSSNGGEAWTDIGPSLSTRLIRQLEFDPGNPDIMYAACKYGVWKSTDQGFSWLETSLDKDVYSIIVDSRNSRRLFAGTSEGVYYSGDGGIIWHNMNSGLTTRFIRCLVFDKDNELLYAGTQGSGVYRYDTGSTGVDDLPGIITSPTLSQNFPNPFNAGTTIKYGLSKPEQVNLKIYDTQGRFITTLIDAFQNQGMHSAEWDGRDHTDRDIPSGIYVAVLLTESGKLTRKLIVQK